MTRLATLALFLLSSPVESFGMAKTSTLLPRSTLLVDTPTTYFDQTTSSFHRKMRQSANRPPKTTRTTSTSRKMGLRDVLNFPRGGGGGSLLSVAKGWNASPGAVFNTSLGALAALTVAFKLFQGVSKGGGSQKRDRKKGRIDFFRLQVTTTRHINTDDITNKFIKGAVVWFFGAFQNHIDHHLFPTMPRPNLRIAHPYIKSFCKQYDIMYHETDTITGIKEVIAHLDAVSKQFVTEFKQIPQN